MLHAPTYLKKAHELLKAKYAWSVVPGLRIARGFADVGFEEYSVLSERKMVSLSTGQIGDIPEAYKDHFFPVYTPDDASIVLYERHIDIESITYLDQRTWIGKFSKNGVVREINASSLEELFLIALLTDIRESENV